MKRGIENTQQQKNKIYFIWKLKKDSYLCTPNRKEGLKNRNGGCREDRKNKIETDETYTGRTRPVETETRRYIKRPPRGTEPNKFLKEMSM